jgi:hypothetical protein
MKFLEDSYDMIFYVSLMIANLTRLGLGFNLLSPVVRLLRALKLAKIELIIVRVPM